MDSIASRLTAARVQKGWTQAQLAKEAGVSQGTVGNIESGVRRSHGSLPRLAEALGVPHNWLRDGGEDKLPTPSVDIDQSTDVEPIAAMRTAINVLCVCLQEMDDDARKEAGDLLQRMAENPAGRWAGRLGELIERESIPRTWEAVGISVRAGNYHVSTQNAGPTMALKSDSQPGDAVAASHLPTGPKDAATGADRTIDQSRGSDTATGSR